MIRMMKTIFASAFRLGVFCVALIISHSVFAGNREPPFAERLSEPCQKLAILVNRGPVAQQKIIDSITDLKADPLITKLEVEHLVALRNSGGGTSQAWFKFYPKWVFDSPDRLEKVLEYFDPNDGSAPRYDKGFEAWVKEWETLYSQHLGELSTLWTANQYAGRRRFIQKLLVEGAVRYAVREKLGISPGYFTYSGRTSLLFVNSSPPGFKSSIKATPRLSKKT